MVRRSIVAVGSVVVLTALAAASSVGASARTGGLAAISAAAPSAGPCASLERAADRPAVCTHGGDPVFPLLARAALVAAARPARYQAVPCVGGTDVVRVFYGYPRDTTPRFKLERPLIRQAVVEADANLGASGAAGYHYRWFCKGETPKLKITMVKLLPIGSDSSFTYSDYTNSMQHQISLGLGKKDYDLGTVDYATFIDNIQGVYPYGGQGSIYGDDRPDPNVNYNNATVGVRKYAMVNFVPAWGVDFLSLAMAHEVGHNLGNVQLSAPHSSGGWHCYDEYDLMCYDDGGSYFQNGGTLQYLCGDPLGNGSESDCGHDDYFNAAPPSGSYLETHWNQASSSWLTH